MNTSIKMKSSVRRPLAFLLTIIAAVAGSKILTWINLKELPSQVGFTLLGSVNWIDKHLAKLFPPEGSDPRQGDLVPPHSFMLPWYLLLAYGSMILAGGLQLGGFLSSLLGAAVAPQSETPLSLFAVSLAFSFSIAIFFLGLWIGARCDRFAIPTLFGVAILGRSIAAAADIFFLNDAQFRQFAGQPKTASFIMLIFVLSIVQSVLLTIPFGLFGFWIGRKRRYGHYVDSVLLKLPKADRIKVAETVYESASELLNKNQMRSTTTNVNTSRDMEVGT